VEGARPARPDDLEACARLLDEARTRAEVLRGGPDLLAERGLPPSPLDERWLAERCAGARPGDEGRRAGALFVGTIDDVVVGIAAGRVTTRGGERIGVIDCCYVETGARNVGVGTTLAESLIGWFAGAGCVAVDAPALPGDRATKQLFESQGLSARLLVLHRRLP